VLALSLNFMPQRYAAIGVAALRDAVTTDVRAFPQDD